MINTQTLEQIPHQKFFEQNPFPWMEVNNFFEKDFFGELAKTWPATNLFAKHTGINRNYGQTPHNRLYLAYEKSDYSDYDESQADEDGKSGIIFHNQLSPQWRCFLDYLKSPEYRNVLEKVFKTSDFELCFAWHMQKNGQDVSPHLDSPKKLGRHLFYFNEENSWDQSWGGGTAVLKGKKINSMAPSFDDFTEIIEANCLGNQSFIFKNSESAWHGMLPLKCPEGSYRKLFNVILNNPSKQGKSYYIKKALNKVASLLQS